MSRSSSISLKLKLFHETERAYLFSDTEEEKRAKWIGKSACEVKILHKPDIYEVALPEKIAKEKGWI